MSGLLAIAFAVVILVWPDLSLFALVILFGALALSRGLVGLYMAIRSPIKQGHGWLVVSSLASIAVGLVAVVFGFVMIVKPGDGAIVLLALVAAYSLVLGIAELTVAIGGRRLFESVSRDYLRAAKPQASHLARGCSVRPGHSVRAHALSAKGARR